MNFNINFNITKCTECNMNINKKKLNDVFGPLKYKDSEGNVKIAIICDKCKDNFGLDNYCCFECGDKTEYGSKHIIFKPDIDSLFTSKCSGKCKNKILRESNIDPKTYAEFNKCTHCKKYGLKYKLCSGCKKVKYCSKDCQKLDWKKHKINCVKL